MVLITGHCSSFDTKVMNVSQKLYELNNFESEKLTLLTNILKFCSFCLKIKLFRKSKKYLTIFHSESNLRFI